MNLQSKIGSRLLLFDWAAWFGVGLVLLYVPVVRDEAIAWYFSLVAVAVAVTFLWGIALVAVQSLASFLYAATFARLEDHSETDQEAVAAFALGMHAVLPVACTLIFWILAR